MQEQQHHRQQYKNRTAILNRINDAITCSIFVSFFCLLINSFILTIIQKKEKNRKKNVIFYVPNLNSPKLPQPIFFPTRKFGPTINIPDELTECLAGYNPLDDLAVAPVVAAAPPPLLVRITSVRPPVAAVPL